MMTASSLPTEEHVKRTPLKRVLTEEASVRAELTVRISRSKQRSSPTYIFKSVSTQLRRMTKPSGVTIFLGVVSLLVNIKAIIFAGPNFTNATFTSG